MTLKKRKISPERAERVRLRKQIKVVDKKIRDAEKEYEELQNTFFRLQERRNTRDLIKKLKRFRHRLTESLRKLLHVAS